LSFSQKSRDVDNKESFEFITVTDSSDLETYLSNALSQDVKIGWNRRLRNKDHKMLMAAFIGQAMKEQDTSVTDKQMQTLLTQKGHDGFTTRSDDFAKIWADVDRTYKVEFNPTSSVIGSITSQEIIKVIT